MSKPSRTEERLRNYLDSSQFLRESMCIALLPLLGPFTEVKPRRPKGGPDGGRDIEAVFSNSCVAWGAVGFRNGGGNDKQARRESIGKCESDIEVARRENPKLTHFVFFTNVDLTPDQVSTLTKFALGVGLQHFEVFDFNRLRTVLDSPAGLIARLQYLDIKMSKTEQLALVNKFGDELQNTFASRLNRVDQTLSRMERFLDFQQPIRNRVFILELENPTDSSALGLEGVLLQVKGLYPIEDTENFLILNQNGTDSSDDGFTWVQYSWLDRESKDELIGTVVNSPASNLIGAMFAYTRCGMHFGVGLLNHISHLRMRVLATSRIASQLRGIQFNLNGYNFIEVIDVATDRKIEQIQLPTRVAFPECGTITDNPVGLEEVIPWKTVDTSAEPPKRAVRDMR